MPVKTGTRQLGIQKGATVQQSKGGVRNVRCQRCGNQAIEGSDGKGGKQFQCPNCKTVYTSSRM